MKVKNLITKLLDFNMDAEVVVSIGDTFDDISDFNLSWGGPNYSEGASSKNAEFIYIDVIDNSERISGDNCCNTQSEHLPEELIRKIEAVVKAKEEFENSKDEDFTKAKKAI